ncbi:hypothetical protein K470DRAFT_257937 [Piedraia hortae CBS 480.64]|uniref:F-box domain-containing protein n=1 Tax=Piedraia hortae CBS 480.64 TaxID=1314780 RepID=A0A6A7BZT8_9PEZI|nr:hypothetical protein K470DRAFT_257937 [Piedraia hortae CBS 480.64]
MNEARGRRDKVFQNNSMLRLLNNIASFNLWHTKKVSPLSMPAEIRNHIFSYVFTPNGNPSQLRVLLVCRHIYEEFKPMAYMRTNFKISEGALRCGIFPKAAPLLIANTLKTVRYITLSIPHPALSRMNGEALPWLDYTNLTLELLTMDLRRVSRRERLKVLIEFYRMFALVTTVKAMTEVEHQVNMVKILASSRNELDDIHYWLLRLVHVSLRHRIALLSAQERKGRDCIVIDLNRSLEGSGAGLGRAVVKNC